VLFYGSKFIVSYRCLDDSWIILHVETSVGYSCLTGGTTAAECPHVYSRLAWRIASNECFCPIHALTAALVGLKMPL
jgi:hypothetical protein